MIRSRSRSTAATEYLKASISCHADFIRCDKRLPGEFTRWAVLNGKLGHPAGRGHRATSSMPGRRQCNTQPWARSMVDFSGGCSQLREDLVGLEALIAYDIDFPEEDDGPVPRDKIERTIAEMIASREALLATAPAGEPDPGRSGSSDRGPPNAGKSSLFNSLLGRSRAIVTEIPGTTRDALEAVVDSGKWPLRLVDTAGLRDTTDPIELLGIEVSERYLASAAVVLACAENSEGPRSDD